MTFEHWIRMKSREEEKWRFKLFFITIASFLTANNFIRNVEKKERNRRFRRFLHRILMGSFIDRFVIWYFNEIHYRKTFNYFIEQSENYPRYWINWEWGRRLMKNNMSANPIYSLKFPDDHWWKSII